MVKQIYLIRGDDREDRIAFLGRVKELATRVASEEKPHRLTFTVTDQKPPGLSVIPFRKDLVAAISIYADHSAPIESITGTGGFSGAYEVEEALPVSYEKTWKNGEPTPGVCLLTLFRQKKGIDRATFLDRWHNGHTPLTLKVHPVWHYNRNVVTEKMVGDSEGHNGIVEEHFLKRAHLLNPAIFFGNPVSMFYNMARVYLDVRSFLDYRSTEPYLTREFHII